MAETTIETAGVSCSRCSAHLPSEAVYCGYCGTTLRGEESPVVHSLVCAKCKKRVLDGSLFCGDCGAAIDGKLAQEEQHSPPCGPDASAAVETSLRATAGGSEGMNPGSGDWMSRQLWIPIGLVTVAAIIIGWVFVARHKGTVSDHGSQTNTASTQPSTGSTSPASKILTKDPEFVRMLNPPQGEALLELSTEYAKKKQDIQSKLASIEDAELRTQVSGEEWGKVDKSLYINDEADKLRASFPAVMRAYLDRHRADWFEIGHVDVLGTSELRLIPVGASPVELNGDVTIPIDVATLDAVYSQFRKLTKSQAEIAVRAWMDAQSCAGVLQRACANLGGTPAEGSDPAKLREIDVSLPGVLNVDCEVNPSAEKGMDIAEKKMRSERLVLVGQGDLSANRTDKVMLVDYDTETVLLTLSTDVLPANKLKWKFATAANVLPNPAQAGEQPSADTPHADTVGVSPEAPQSDVKEVYRKRAVLSNASNPQPRNSGGTPEVITPPSARAPDLSGNWHGEYTNHDTNQITKVNLKISKDRTDLLTGILMFGLGGSNSASCAIAGVYNSQSKFMLLNVGNCQGHPPAYLQGKIGFSSVKPADRQVFGVDSLHNSLLNISRQ